MTRQRALGRTFVVFLVLVLVVGGIYVAVTAVQRSETLVTERCTAVVGDLSANLSTDQAANAALITAVAVRRGLPARAATIALATAMQESRLQNIDYGDTAGPDSRGLFQQRPTQGWGTEAQVMDPYYAANAFYDVLVTIPDYQNLEITDAAQRVQRSAFPEAYAKHENMGRAFASGLTGQSPAAINCTLRPPETSGNADDVTAALVEAFGAIATTSAPAEVRVESAQPWSVAQWAVSQAKNLGITAVDVDGRSWDRTKGSSWVDTDTAPGVTIHFAPATGSAPAAG
ncbi:hypothetical protein [Pseudarthrobacter sp. PS3-L1]|uniref:hypothetical protein n=1 Tax=Pseudarthrobacter sp. PS3-L1 TaxID=3046207 RepID=UPI0024B91607|nr:hypothetical protein [Pseudarthrobacter sp. PS3-L1]MDJ0321401.1 hypothetical protein [Pseudarthrobacter sp. PS3-L1]